MGLKAIGRIVCSVRLFYPWESVSIPLSYGSNIETLTA